MVRVSTEMLKAWILIGALVAGVNLSGCASVETAKRLDSLNASLWTYTKALRWGYYEEALSYIVHKNYTEPMRPREYMENIRIASYDIVDQRMSLDETEADVLAVISFYHVDQGTVLTLRDRQHWWYDEEQKHWFLDGDLPDFASALKAKR